MRLNRLKIVVKEDGDNFTLRYNVHYFRTENVSGINNKVKLDISYVKKGGRLTDKRQCDNLCSGKKVIPSVAFAIIKHNSLLASTETTLRATKGRKIERDKRHRSIGERGIVR